MHKWILCCVAFAAATASAAIPSTERDALIALYEAAGGPAWTQKQGWLGAAGTECEWFGVKCDAAGATVIRIELDDNNLRGRIPPAIRGLTNLEILVLINGDLEGPIPRELAELTKLQAVGLWNNRLGGQIPPEIWGMTWLYEFWADQNQLTGSIPPEIGDMRNLEYLSLWANLLSGPIPAEITKLDKLVELWLADNEFTGTIPEQIGDLRSLEVLELWGTALTGPIPRSIGSLSRLRSLALGTNDLNGPIPPEIGSLTSLEVLHLAGNELSGEPPDTLRNLTRLQWLDLERNRLTGPVPAFLEAMSALRILDLSENQFEGPIPPALWRLTNLELLVLSVNRLSGTISPDIGNLAKLEFLSIQLNALSGPIPPSIGNLKNLEYIFAGWNELTGPIPREMWTLDKLLLLNLGHNHLDGELAPDVGSLTELEDLDLGANRLTGTIPREIANLKKLEVLDLSYNAFRGAIPPEIAGLTALAPGYGLDLSNNALVTSDPALRDFLDDFNLEQQTVPPSNVRVAGATDRSVTLEWQRIPYWFAEGGYQIQAREDRGGSIVAVTTTEWLSDTSGVVRGLAPETAYTFTVSAITYPDFWQQNVIVSDPSPAVSATTAVRVLSPPLVELTEEPRGLVQVDGVAVNEDRFVLTNFGDRPSSITLEMHAEFAVVEPAAFTLNPGATQTVVVKSLPRGTGSYAGFATAQGEGAGNFIWLTLLSVAKPAGTARAEAVDTRVEVAGLPGSDSVGQARFRNVGDTQLSGMLISDQPWVVPESSRVFISPGSVSAVNFTVVRARRPPGTEGSLSANLSLLYVDGSPLRGQTAIASTTPGISVAKVTVVDVAKPAVSSSTIPSLGGQIAYFLPGVASFVRQGTPFVSDLSLLNESGAQAITDLRLYYTPAGANQTSVATLSSIAATQSVTFTNLVSSVYGAESQVGSLQLRTAQWDKLVVQAQLLGLSGAGSVGGEVPVFRSDRSVPSGQRLYLTGVRKTDTAHTDLFLQETQGAETTARLEFFGADGLARGGAVDVPLTPYGMAELADRVPSGAATAVVANSGGGRIAAYARVVDERSGDHWSIVDWSRHQDFKPGEVMRVPIVEGAAPGGSGGRKRRAVGHDTAARGATDLFLFNPSEEDAIAAVELIDASGSAARTSVVVGPRRTVTLPDVGAESRTATAQVVITPLHQKPLLATVRTSGGAARSTGTGIPVVAGPRGLRLGRSQTFSNLEDSATHRTSLGLVESAGEPVTVRARIFLDEGRSLATSAIYRDFELGPNRQILASEIVRAIVGAARDNLDDLHNLQLRLEVIGGRGAVVPFVILTDSASGDSILRLE